MKRKLKRDQICNLKVNKFVQHLGLEDRVVLVKSDKRFAFCLGVRSTKIYFSTGLLENLSRNELEAVLRHEQYHLENHDTFTMVLASAAYSIFPFFPLINDLINKYKIKREIAADKYAVKKIGNQYPLISALRKLLAFPATHNVAVAAIADQDTLEPRIYALLNKAHTISGIKVKNIVVSIQSFLILVFLNAYPIHAQELHHDHYDVVVLSPNNNLVNSHTNEKYNDLIEIKLADEAK